MSNFIFQLSPQGVQSVSLHETDDETLCLASDLSLIAPCKKKKNSEAKIWEENLELQLIQAEGSAEQKVFLQ